ncbi:MAG TPA: hypothetical protein VH561_20965 [Micromonosporaceae bacterium]|jgi:vacuolar-type H+-ATPase subunit H
MRAERDSDNAIVAAKERRLAAMSDARTEEQAARIGEALLSRFEA